MKKSESFKPIINKKRTKTEEYEVCPHCNKEIGEKALFYDGNHWYHRSCPDKPIG